MKNILISVFIFSLFVFPTTIVSVQGQNIEPKNQISVSVDSDRAAHFISQTAGLKSKTSKVNPETTEFVSETAGVDSPQIPLKNQETSLSSENLSSNPVQSSQSNKTELSEDENSVHKSKDQPKNANPSQISEEEIDYLEGLVRAGIYSIADQQGDYLLDQLRQQTSNDSLSLKIAAILIDLYQNEWFLANESNRINIEEKFRSLRSLIEKDLNHSPENSFFQTSLSFPYGISIVSFLLTTAEINRLENSQPLDSQISKLSEAKSIIEYLYLIPNLDFPNLPCLDLFQAVILREIAIQYSNQPSLFEENLKNSLNILRKMEQPYKNSNIIWLARFLQIGNYRLLENNDTIQKLSNSLLSDKTPAFVQNLLNIEKIELLLKQNEIEEASKLLEANLSLENNNQEFNNSFFNKILFNISEQNQYLAIQVLMNHLKTAEDSESKNELTQKIQIISQRIQSSVNPYWETKTSILLRGIIETSTQWTLVEAEAEKAFLNKRYEEAILLYDQAAQTAFHSQDNSNAFRLSGIVIGILEQLIQNESTDDSQKDKTTEWKREIIQRSFDIAHQYPDQELAIRIYLSGLNQALQLVAQQELSLDDYLQKRLDFLALFPNYPEQNSFLYQTAQIFLENNNIRQALEQLSLIPIESELAISVLELAKKCFETSILSASETESPNQIRSAAIVWFLNRLVPSIDQSLSILYANAIQELIKETTNRKALIAWTVLYAIDEQFQIQYQSDDEKQKSFSELETLLQKILNDIQDHSALYDVSSSVSGQNALIKTKDELLSNIQADLFYILIEQNRSEEAEVLMTNLEKGSSSLTLINNLIEKIPTLPDAIQKNVAQLCLNQLEQSLQQKELSLEEQKNLQINQAKSLRWLGRSQDSLNLFAVLLKEYPNDLVILESIAELLTSQKDLTTIEKSLIYWDKITRIAEEGSENWFHAKEQMIFVSNRLGKKEQTQKWIRLLKLTHPNFGSEIRRQKMEQLLQSLENN